MCEHRRGGIIDFNFSVRNNIFLCVYMTSFTNLANHRLLVTVFVSCEISAGSQRKHLLFETAGGSEEVLVETPLKSVKVESLFKPHFPHSLDITVMVQFVH